MTTEKSTGVPPGDGDGDEPGVPFSDLIARIDESAGGVRLEVPDDWMQGRSVFGGLQVVVALRAMRQLVPDVPLRALQTTFIGPVGPVVSASARVLRRGKSVTHVEAQLGDGDAPQALVIGVFGKPRASAASVTPVQPEVAGASGREMGFVPGVVPNFIQHFCARWLRGAPPFTGDTGTQHVIEVAMRDRPPTSEAHVIAFADFIPPMALTHLRTPAPGTSATWSLELLADRFDQLPLSGWRVDGTLVAARDGYTSQSVMLWGPGGVPIAVSHQSMLVFG